jgi:hypothetical protein
MRDKEKKQQVSTSGNGKRDRRRIKDSDSKKPQASKVREPMRDDRMTSPTRSVFCRCLRHLDEVVISMRLRGSILVRRPGGSGFVLNLITESAHKRVATFGSLRFRCKANRRSEYKM